MQKYMLVFSFPEVSLPISKNENESAWNSCRASGIYKRHIHRSTSCDL